MAESIAVGGGEEEGVTSAKVSGCRKEKRKAAKKEKRKQLRKELAAKAREEEEAWLNDPEEQRKIQLEEEREKDRLERERKEFEEREKLFLEALAKKRAEEEEEEERRKALEEESKKNQQRHENDSKEDDEWEYVEEGPPEIIWQGNEIIVKKNKVRVKKKDVDQHTRKEDADRPTSNPLPPQSDAFADYQNASAVSVQQLLENVAQQIPNFGTEQDKAHCPFHIKTGACRFGSRCSRVHFYPDKSCTLLMKNMYNGPGLAWEQDEGLEYTDEEVERCYEEFYEDVHTEFLKYGEIVNFKVCRNGAFHLRGNLYVHYKSLDSAVEAYNSFSGRYFACKQVKCEFVGVTRWKVAICGEYMKSRLKTCSRGTACNFIHCFRNPGGDYEWADWDKPPPRYWTNKMAALFGHSDDSGYDKQMEQQNLGQVWRSSKMGTADRDRYHSRRSQSREKDSTSGRSSRSHYEENDVRKSTRHYRYTSDVRKQHRTVDEKNHEEEADSKNYRRQNSRTSDNELDRDKEAYHDQTRKSSRHHVKVKEFGEHSMGNTSRARETDSDDGYLSDCNVDREKRHGRKRKSLRHPKKSADIYKDSGGKNVIHDAESRDSIRDRDGNISENNWNGDMHHDGTRKHSRHHHVSSNSRFRESNSDEDLSEIDRNRERNHGHKSKRSRHRKQVSEVQYDYADGKSGTSDTNYQGTSLHEDRDSHRDGDEHGQRKSSKRRKKQTEIYDDSRRIKNGIPGADSHEKRDELNNKNSGRSNEVSTSPNDHWDSRSRTHDSDRWIP